MQNFLDFVNSPFGYLILTIVFSIILKKMKVKHIKLLNIFIETIERVDKEIVDIVPPEYEKKLAKAKKMVSVNINRKQKKLIDKLKIPIEAKISGKKTVH